VVAALERRGAVFVQETDEVPPGARLVLSAHGVEPDVYVNARDRDVAVIDATCPLVTKIHREARRFAAGGYTVFLIGQSGHDEVVGTRGQAPDRVIVVSHPHDVEDIDVPDGQPVAWVSQSTLASEDVAAVVERLRLRFPSLVDPHSEDICYAVSNRQAALRRISAESDLVVVVGGRNSHNSAMLVPVALLAGARAAHRVESASELRPEWLVGVVTVGLTGGASTPEILIRDALTWLSGYGFTHVTEVTSTVESQVFARPRALTPRATARVGRRTAA
jgi:4-hydroxy-3-methylbut-2-enyl diphosphate reductase